MEYMNFFCQSFNTSLCFSDLKAAGHFLHLLLRADVTDPYRVLLKNGGVAEGQMQNAFQSPLLLPPLSGLSRKPVLGNGGLPKPLRPPSPAPDHWGFPHREPPLGSAAGQGQRARTRARTLSPLWGPASPFEQRGQGLGLPSTERCS